MTEETKTEMNETNEMDNVYLDKIKELKQNSVSREDYNKLVEQNKQLLDSFITNDFSNNKEPEKPKPDVEKLRKEFLDCASVQATNLETVKRALALRDAVLDEGKADPFLPPKVPPYSPEAKRADKVAEIFKHCIDYADGDAQAFTNELQRLTNDTGINASRY